MRSGSGWRLNIKACLDRSRRAALCLFGVAAFHSPGLAQQADPVVPCRPFVFETRHYLRCDVDVGHFDVAVSWRGNGNVPHGTIGNYLRQLTAREKSRLVFAMNAGMYEPDLGPVGLLIERGKEQAGLNTGTGGGNFYWKPNGVFFVGDGKAGIRETASWLADPPKAEFATQSGPILVSKGSIGSAILASTSSRNIRNGVGVRDEAHAVFVISEEGVSFAEFARLFRDGLSCQDALYFDGVISELYAPSLKRGETGHSVGPIVAVFAREAPSPGPESANRGRVR
jgi:uncharacterized protein YigE (DUF2233 family)